MGAVDEPADRRKFTGTSDRFSARAIDARGVSDDVVKPATGVGARGAPPISAARRTSPRTDARGMSLSTMVRPRPDLGADRARPRAAGAGRRPLSTSSAASIAARPCSVSRLSDPTPPLPDAGRLGEGDPGPRSEREAPRGVHRAPRAPRGARQGHHRARRRGTARQDQRGAWRRETPRERRRKPPPRRAPSRPRPLTIPTPDARRSSRASKATPPRSPPPTSRRSSSRSGSCIWCASDRDDAPVRAPDSATGPRGSSRRAERARLSRGVFFQFLCARNPPSPSLTPPL